MPDSVTFNAGGPTEMTFTFIATQDTVDDEGESVLLGFGPDLSGGVRAGTPDETTLTITDDDPPEVSFGQSAYTVAEGGMVSVEVKLTSAPASAVTVPVTHTPQGATSSGDYSGVPANVMFSAGETSKAFTFTATQDTVDDDGESVLLEFGTLPDTVQTGTTTQTTVTITDDDAPEVSFGESAYTVAEGGMVSAVTVPVTHTPQGATSAADYSGVPANLTFNTGDTSKAFMFSATQDMYNDDGESVLLTFGTLPPAVRAGTPGETTVTITDDDDPAVMVSFGSATYTVAEGGTVEVTVTLSANPERTVIIPITKVNQGTASDTDYSGVPSGVTFQSGETSKSFDFSATQDTEDDDGESVRLGFGSMPDARVSAGTPDETTVNITDDDVPSVMFEQGTYTVAEGGTVEVTVTLSADPERTVTIPMTKVNQGTASDADYSGVPSSVTFQSGETERSIIFSATQDTIDDDGESVRLAFGSTLPDRVSAGATSETVVSITDDDVPSVAVRFEQGTYTVAEGGTVEVTVTLSADPERTVVIPITKVNQGTASDADYSGVPDSVVFASGETERSIIFSATQDTIDDDGESVRLAFGSTLPDRVSAGATSETVVSITDDDVPSIVVVSFGSAAYTVTEGGTVEVTVTLDDDPERTITVPIATANVGGISDSDYSGVPGSVTFSAGDTRQTFTFAAADDNLEDSGEGVKLSFVNLPPEATLGTTSEATVTIINKAAQNSLTVAFQSAAYSVSEGNSVSVTVILSAAPGSEVTVPLTVTEQGGAISADYSGVPASVTFGPDERDQTFTVTATQDMVDDDGESVVIGFGTLSDGVREGGVGNTIVDIRDDDDPPEVAFGQSAYTVAEGGCEPRRKV